MLTQRISMTVFVIACLLASLACVPAQAAYAPANLAPSTPEQKKIAKKAVNMLKSWPRICCESFLADKLHLYYMPYGAAALDSRGWVKKEALFVGSDGVPHMSKEGFGTLYNIDHSAWKQCSYLMREAQEENVLYMMKGEVTALILTNVKHHLASMPPLMRDALLAQMAGLLVTVDGESGYTGNEAVYRLDHMDLEIRYDEPDPNAHFYGSDGVEHSLQEINVYRKEWQRRWVIVFLAAQYIGKKDILKLMPNELNAMRKSRAKMPKPVSIDHLSIPGLPENFAGIKAFQPGSKPALTPELLEKANELKQIMNRNTISARDSFIAEKADLVYMENGSLAFKPSNGWCQNGSLFTSSDGQEYRFWDKWAEMRKTASWSKSVAIANSLGFAHVYDILNDEIRSLALATAKHLLTTMPPLLRDAWLTQATGLLYTADHQNAATDLTNTITTDRGKEIQVPYYKPDALFCDTQGVEHSQLNDPEITRLMPQWERRMTLLYLCAAIASTREIVFFMQNEWETLLQRYKEATAPTAAAP